MYYPPPWVSLLTITTVCRFWAAVSVIFVSNFALPKWVREKVVVSVDVCISFLGFVYFLVSTRRLMRWDITAGWVIGGVLYSDTLASPITPLLCINTDPCLDTCKTNEDNYSKLHHWSITWLIVQIAPDWWWVLTEFTTTNVNDQLHA